MGIVRQTQNLTASIAASETNSGAIYIGDYSWGGIQFAAEFTGSSVTVLVSLDNVNFNALCDATGEPIDPIPFAANRAVPLPDEAFYHPYLILQSSDAEANDRSILVFLKG
jgi:hypothetical protein